MKKLWEKNKRFILIVVAGLVVILFGWNYARSAVVDSSGRVNQAQTTINNEVDEVSERFLQSEWRAEKESNLLEKDKSVKERLETLIAPEPRTRLPADNPGAVMRKLIDDAIRAIDEKGRRRGTKVSTKNWGIGSLISDRDTADDLKVLLMRLEATERLLILAIDEACLREIESVRQLSSVRLPVAHSGGEKEIELLPVEVTCYGTAKALSRLAFEIGRERDDGKHNFFYLREAKITSGKRKSTRKRPGHKRLGLETGSGESTRCGTFVCCALRVVKSEGKKSTRGPKRSRYGGRRGRRRR